MDKIFIEQAKQIRREFIKNSKDVAKCENNIEIYKKQLSKIKEELKENMDKQEMLEKLALIERNIKIIEKILEPFEKKVKQLEKDADKLYENIKERHSSMSPEDIKRELIPHLFEIKF